MWICSGGCREDALSASRRVAGAAVVLAVRRGPRARSDLLWHPGKGAARLCLLSRGNWGTLDLVVHNSGTQEAEAGGLKDVYLCISSQLAENSYPESCSGLLKDRFREVVAGLITICGVT
ncbi:hypothetical protein STEG23_019931 [Scotinomys teguina]